MAQSSWAQTVSGKEMAGMGTSVPDRNCVGQTGRGRSSWQLFDQMALSGLRELSDVSAHGIEIASAMPASLYILNEYLDDKKYCSIVTGSSGPGSNGQTVDLRKP